MFCIWLSQVRCGHVSPEDRQKNVPSVGQLQLTRSGASLSFFCGIALIILGLLIFSEGAGAEAIRIAYGGTAGYNVPLWVGQEGGYFKKQGFSTELILTQLDIHALLANEVQVVNTAGFVPIQARLQGGDVVIVATSYNFIPYSFVVHKDIRSPSDLKGKRIALSRLGGITELAARLAFERLGLNPKEATFCPGRGRCATDCRCSVRRGRRDCSFSAGTFCGIFTGASSSRRSRRLRGQVSNGGNRRNKALPTAKSSRGEEISHGFYRRIAPL
jgi:hypothetical protein